MLSWENAFIKKTNANKNKANEIKSEVIIFIHLFMLFPCFLFLKIYVVEKIENIIYYICLRK